MRLRGLAALAILMVSTVPLALAEDDDDRIVGPGTYSGMLSPDTGDDRDGWRLAPNARYGASFVLQVPAAVAHATHVHVFESFGGGSTGYLTPDASGTFRWQGGSESGGVAVSITNFYDAFDYTIELSDFAMPDLEPTVVAVSAPREGGLRTVSVEMKNFGAAASPPSRVAVDARHFDPYIIWTTGLDTVRHIASVEIPALAPGEYAAFDVEWNTFGERGRVEVWATADLLDATWINNARGTTVDLDGTPAPGIDPLNTRVATDVSPFWIVAGGSSPNGAPGARAGLYLWGTNIRLATVEAGVSHDATPRGALCVYDDCRDLFA